MSWELRCIDSLSKVSGEVWNSLQPSVRGYRYPFTTHEFLHTLEATGCVDEATGWQPAHVLLESVDDRLCAAAPCYLKYNSFGEFVFDFSWAQAYRQLGMSYYPKLICAVPYSPVVGPRIFATDEKAHDELSRRLLALPERLNATSLHFLFGRRTDHHAMTRSGAVCRRDCQYHWFNRGYTDFHAFLAELSSKRRKEIRRERKRVAEAGISIRVLAPGEVDDALLRQLYTFYSRTYLVRGQRPYLSFEFFRQIGDRLPHQVLYFIAFKHNQPLAMAFMLRDDNSLYGRHWGCLEDYHSLHFETCYYAGIDYCIAHGLQRFDAGAQGEHKLRRGFEPVATYSAHYLRHPGLQAAVEDFVRREADMVADYHADARAHCAFPGAQHPDQADQA